MKLRKKPYCSLGSRRRTSRSGPREEFSELLFGHKLVPMGEVQVVLRRPIVLLTVSEWDAPY